jgi:hypothetical protein
LILQIKKLKNSDIDYILLGIDANADILNDKKGLIKLCAECDLVDMFTSIHDEDECFPTHIKGSKRIDYILCSPNLLRFVNKVGYIQFHQAFDSDHRAVFCDLDPTILQGEQEDNIHKLERIIGTNSTNQEGDKYIRELNGFCEYHNLYKKVGRIYSNIKTNKM